MLRNKFYRLFLVIQHHSLDVAKCGEIFTNSSNTLTIFLLQKIVLNKSFLYRKIVSVLGEFVKISPHLASKLMLGDWTHL